MQMTKKIQFCGGLDKGLYGIFQSLLNRNSILDSIQNIYLVLCVDGQTVQERYIILF